MKEILDILSQKSGIVIGEYHTSKAPLKFLIDNAIALKNLGVKYIFTEKFESLPGKFGCRAGSRFNDEYEKYLKDENDDKKMSFFCENANGQLAKRKSFSGNDKNTYTMEEFLLKMKVNGIVVVGVNNAEVAQYDTYAEGNDGIDARDKSAEILNEHIVKCVKDVHVKSNEKVIVWVGVGHAGTRISRQKKICGVDGLLNFPSIYICEAGLEHIIWDDGNTIPCDKLIKCRAYSIVENKDDLSSSEEFVETNYIFSMIVINDARFEKPLLYIQQIQNKLHAKPMGPSNTAKNIQANLSNSLSPSVSKTAPPLPLLPPKTNPYTVVSDKNKFEHSSSSPKP